MMTSKLADFQTLVDRCRDADHKVQQKDRNGIDYCFLGQEGECVWRESSGKCVKYNKVLERHAYNDVQVLTEAYGSCRRQG